MSTERDEFLRAAWRVMIADHSIRGLIFVDECGLTPRWLGVRLLSRGASELS